MNILLVEDDRKLARAMVAMFEEDEHGVDVAHDGERGLELGLEHPYDVIVLDLMLPRMDGYKVCRALKFDERYRHIPIFILSARSAESDRRLAVEMGADEVHTKPYDMKSLIARVRARVGEGEQDEHRAAA